MSSCVRELRVKADLANLSKIAEFVTACCEGRQVSEQDIFNIQLAVDEAATNIIKHAYENGEGEVHILCWVEGRNFWVELHDKGRHFEPDEVTKPVVTGKLAEREVGGLGLYFMRSLMDEVRFDFNENGNRLVMVKRGIVP